MFKCSEQLLFSCVSSKVSICNYVTCRMSYVTFHMSNAYVDRWDMLNYFCFHVYAQNSLFDLLWKGCRLLQEVREILLIAFDLH